MVSPWLFGYLFLFFILVWKNYRLGVGLFILFLPAYLLRFQLGPLPTTLLELNFAVLWFIWFIKYFPLDRQKISAWIKKHYLMSILTVVFLLSATVGIFVGNATYQDSWSALLRGAGIWKAYFVEPILLFFLLIGRTSNEENDPDRISLAFILRALILSTASVSLLAIAQQFTPGLNDPSLWNDNFGARSTSFFTSPNAIGLYIAPIFPLILALFFRSQNKKEKMFLSVFLTLNLMAILFSFSDGAWVALGAALIIFVWLIGRRKLTLGIVGLCVILLLFFPRFQNAVRFQDQAGQNRLTLWGYTINFLTDSPQNFIFGAGTRKFFHRVQKPNYNPAELERLGYPHNIFLNFWAEIGLTGALSFVGIFILSAYHTILLKKENMFLGAGFFAALAVIFIHGLVDVPYFKNDLAMIFWLLITLIFCLTPNYPPIAKIKPAPLK